MLTLSPDLTGAHPTPVSSSLAGTTHDLALATPYYNATVPVWLDLTDNPSEWAASFLSDEAREVRDALGAVVVIFSVTPHDAAERAAATRRLVEGVGKVVREGLGGWEWDGVGLGVGVGEVDGDGDGDGGEVLDGWEDACAEWGMEFVHVPATKGAGAGVKAGEDKTAEEKRNEFGGGCFLCLATITFGVVNRLTEKTGIPRVLEALQANDWSQAGFDEDEDEDYDEAEDAAGTAAGSRSGTSTKKTKEGKGSVIAGVDENDELNPESLDFGFDREDFAGLRKAIWNTTGEEDEDNDEFMDKPGVTSKNKAPGGGGGGVEEGDEVIGEGDVQKLEGMMKKLLAVRDMSAGLPEEQRKRMAKNAVAEVMKEL